MFKTTRLCLLVGLFSGFWIVSSMAMINEIKTNEKDANQPVMETNEQNQKITNENETNKIVNDDKIVGEDTFENLSQSLSPNNNETKVESKVVVPDPKGFWKWVAELRQTRTYKAAKYILGSAAVILIARNVWISVRAIQACSGDPSGLICPAVFHVQKDYAWLAGLFTAGLAIVKPYALATYNFFANHAIEYMEKSKDFVCKKIPALCPARTGHAG